MKTIKMVAFALLAAANVTLAQILNYQKLKVPSVDAGGKVYDASGNLLGNVTKNGFINNASGTKVAYFDAFNAIIDANTTEPTGGRSDANGNFLIVKNKKVTSWKPQEPENPGIQLCLVKDKNGKIVATVHKQFRLYGPGSIYYLKQLSGSDDKEEATASATPAKKKTTTKKKTTVKKKTTAKPAAKKKKKK